MAVTPLVQRLVMAEPREAIVRELGSAGIDRLPLLAAAFGLAACALASGSLAVAIRRELRA